MHNTTLLQPLDKSTSVRQHPQLRRGICMHLLMATSTLRLGTDLRERQPFYGPLSGTTRVSQYQKKHSPTHHPDHHPIFISFFHLPRSVASSLFKLRAWQSFLHNLSPCTLWSTSWSGALHLIFHTFLHPISVFFS